MPDQPPAMTVRYGRPNRDLISRWARMESDEGGPFWALNLMKYRAVADYGDGAASAKSGREADDEYTPRGPLAAIGATIVFAADVERTLAGDETTWDRVGIVRYPTRKKFLEMQQREDFKRQHIHKDAGMEFTIVMSCLPRLPFAAPPERTPYVELRVSADDVADRDAGVLGVEGVIIGDERTWRTAAFRWLASPPDPSPPRATKSEYTLLLRPMVDQLARSVEEARGIAS